MANPTASVNVSYYSCWIDPLPPLPNPVLPYPTELPTPVITPADYCSVLIYQWLTPYVGRGILNNFAYNLWYEAQAHAFDLIDIAAYVADLAVIAAQYNADVAQAVADYQADVNQRITDMATCEASRYPQPDPAVSGVKVIVLANKLPTRSSATTRTGGLRTTLKLHLSAA